MTKLESIDTVRERERESHILTKQKYLLEERKNARGITLIALVVTIVLNCSFLAMVVERGFNV